MPNYLMGKIISLPVDSSKRKNDRENFKMDINAVY